MVTQRQKVSAAAGVMALGFALAWLVGRPGTSGEVVWYDASQVTGVAVGAPIDADDLAPLDSPFDATMPAERRPAGPPPSDGQLTAANDVVSVGATAGLNVSGETPPTRPRRIQKTAPPDLPSSFHSDARPPSDAQLVAIEDPTTGHAPAKLVDHVVHNGDTLERLAHRYLGDESRAIEIFELNRDVLKNPHILPIGAELRIVLEPTR